MDLKVDHLRASLVYQKQHGLFTDMIFIASDDGTK